jgi:hypothetical protein
MVKNIDGLKGEIGKLAPPGVVVKGIVESLTAGKAIDYMSADNCRDRQTDPDTPFINIEIGIPEYGVINNISFRDYSDGDDGIISPNTKQGKIMATYPDIKKGSEVNMVAAKKEKGDGSIVVWRIVTV